MDVVVATQRIEQGASLQPEMLTQPSVPLDATNEMALTDPVLAHGKQAAIDILPNQVITPNMLVGD